MSGGVDRPEFGIRRMPSDAGIIWAWGNTGGRPLLRLGRPLISDHRFDAALRAISARRSLVSLLARAFPPFCPISTAAGLRLSSVLSSTWPVAIPPMSLARAMGSRGRLRGLVAMYFSQLSRLHNKEDDHQHPQASKCHLEDVELLVSEERRKDDYHRP